jgi:K+-sensing histidine kinase KdpD
MKEFVAKEQDRITEDPVQMAAKSVAYNIRNLLEAIRSRATMALCQDEIPINTRPHMAQIVQFVEQSNQIIDYLTHVFKPFYSHGTDRHSANKGLGLTLAWNIVERHDGVIDIWSTPGRGSALSIFLPLEHQVEKENGTHSLGAYSSFPP